jgi:predicted aspartyl protease
MVVRLMLLAACLLTIAGSGCARNTTPAATSLPLASLPQLRWIEVPLARSADGLFVAEAEVRGSKLLLLLDSGAAKLALDRRAAERLGLPLESTESKAVGLGAGGVSSE